MNVLVTGASGFIGKNLCAALKNIKYGKDKTRPNIKIDEIFEFDKGVSENDFESFCEKADFVFHLAGVNRPENEVEYADGNVGLTEKLVSELKKNGNRPVMLSSSVQAEMKGRYNEGYAESKRQAEKIIFDYAAETNEKVFVYRFPNVFGKWCKPNYNSAVATFCYNIARNIPVVITDEKIKLELVYIDDLVCELLNALENKEHRRESRDGEEFCFVPVTHEKTLGEIVKTLRIFKSQPETLIMPEMPSGSFEKKLFSTYLSYLPEDKTVYPFLSKKDERGSFTEIFKTEKCGQFSVNVSKPGVTKGEHWHNGKWEIFVVVSGNALIKERNLATGEIREFTVSGENPQAVYMLPGFTHSIKNLSETENLVTLMWANEQFDISFPDTFYENV